MKGRTNQPVVIAVAPEYEQHPKIQELKAQGHTIMLLNLGEIDLLLHPAAHQWNDMQWDFLPAALVAARQRAKRRKGKL